MKTIKFNGALHHPVGNTKLRVYKGALEVIDMNSYQDGISIITQAFRKWKICLKPMLVCHNAVLGVTLNSMKGKELKTISQWIITYSPDGKYAYILLNTLNCNCNIIVIGWYSGEQVYHNVLETSMNEKWLITVVFYTYDKSLILTETSYNQYLDESTPFKKFIGINGWICLNDIKNTNYLNNTNSLVRVDKISLHRDKRDNSRLDYEFNDIDQIIITGQNVKLSILNDL